MLGTFLPVIGQPLQWLLALVVNVRREPGEARTYGRRCLALALFDTIAWLGVLLVGLGVIAMPEPAASGPRLGVQLDSDDPRPGALIAEVAAGSPADEAGLASGDRIRAIDGVAVEDRGELIAAVSNGTAGAERRLVVERNGEEHERVVVPRVLTAPEVEPRGLFEVGPQPPGPEGGGASGLVLILVLFTLAIVAAARRAGGAWRVALLIVVVQGIWLTASALGQLLPTKALGGFTSGGMLIGIAAGSLCGGVATWLAIAALRQRGLLPPARRASLARLASTFLLGALLVVAILPRAAGLAIGLSGLLEHLGMPSAPFDPGEMFRASGMTPLGTWLLLGMIVLLAPLYEELLFRGLLLPWLERGRGAVFAILASALVFGAMHAHYGPFFLVTAGLGVAFGWARVRSGGVLVPWLLHALWNFGVSWSLWWPLVAGA